MNETSDQSPDPSSTLATLGEAARSHWRLTGELPTAPSDTETPPLESSPAEPAEQAASTDAPVEPASEPGTPTTRKPNAESRKAELKAEIDTLLTERARLRAEVDADRAARLPAAPPTPPQAAPSPAKADQPFPSFDQWIAADPARANVSDAYLDYIDARAEAKASAIWEAKQRDAQQRDAERTRSQAVETRKSAFGERLRATVSADPDFMARLDSRWQQAVPVDILPAGTQPNALNIVAQEVLLSEHGPAMMAHLSAHPSEFDRLLSYQTQDAIVRAMGRLEASLSSVAPTAKVVSAGPAIGTTVGKKASGPIDEADAALTRGDFRAYAAAMNSRGVGASAPSSAKR